MKKVKILNKIENLFQEVAKMETEIRTVLNDPQRRDYPRIQSLCEGINISFNQITILEELMQKKEKLSTFNGVTDQIGVN